MAKKTEKPEKIEKAKKTEKTAKTEKATSVKPKLNLLQQVAQQKAAEQALGGKSGMLGKDLSKRYGSPNSFSPQKPTKRGGRNAQGKP